MAEHGAAAGRLSYRWGPSLLGNGRVRFRLWAPGLERLDLRLDRGDLPMLALADGWFEVDVDGMAAEQTYAFVLPDGRALPDPASRSQAGDVHAPSRIVDASAYRWKSAAWRGRPWREAVLYELHVGTFTPEGTFRGAASRLPYLADLGVTAVELMPVAQFAGGRGWGYDGVLLYAPHPAYGDPDDLRHFVDTAHGLGLMVLLDVVYNHFGPEGNYLSAYAPAFFLSSRSTPWGEAIAYERDAVRSFFVENAMYWLDDFRLDGLRLDAVDHIRDPAQPELLFELAETVRAAFPDRHVHLTTEDNRNVTHFHQRRDGRPVHYSGEWNDDFHNAAHALLTGEGEGYYIDFSDDPTGRLARCLAEGFAYQGEMSAYAGAARGAPSALLPTTAFIDFLQNHDQIGNRALGERLETLVAEPPLAALSTILLLSPHIPLLFMGQEWAETRPFLFFTDFEGPLADAVREGRRTEFAQFSAFHGAADRASIPDPNALSTFESSRIDWSKRDRADHRRSVERFRALLALRRRVIVPLLDDGQPTPADILAGSDGALAIDWRFPGGKRLHLRANLAERPQALPPMSGAIVYATADEGGAFGSTGLLGPWEVIVGIGP